MNQTEEKPTLALPPPPAEPKPTKEEREKELDELLADVEDEEEDNVTTTPTMQFDFDQDYDADQTKTDDSGDRSEDFDDKETDDMLVAYEQERLKRKKIRFTVIMTTMIAFSTLLRWWDENDGGFLDSDFLLVEYFIFTAGLLYIMGTLILKPIFFWPALVASEDDRTVAAAAKPFEDDGEAKDDSVKKMNAALVARRRR